MTMKTSAFLFALLAVACGSKPKPVEPQHVELDASAPIDASPPDVPDAAPEAAPPPRTISLCSVAERPEAKQCLHWSGCAGGMVLSVGGKPFRKCTAKTSECDETEEKLVMASQRIAPGARKCTTRFYLAKEVDIADQKWTVCPEDAEDKELSVLWKRIVPSCRQPLGE
jgi:hypothetical protein